MPDGEIGELAAKRGDPVMFLGYWNNEKATREKCAGDWFRTGDTGYRDPEGYFWFVGRNDDVISTAGHRVGPGEVEDCMLKHPAVAQVAVIGSPDELRGQIIKAFVVLAAGHSPSPELVDDIQKSVSHSPGRPRVPTQNPVRGLPAHDHHGEGPPGGASSRGKARPGRTLIAR